MSTQLTIDWKAAEQRFLENACAALDLLERKHSPTPLSFFAFRSNYYEGRNSIAVDSYANSLGKAKEHQDWVVRNRLLTMTHATATASARYHWTHSSKRIVDYTPHTGEFWMPDFMHVNFPDWEFFFRGRTTDDSVGSQGHVIVLFWRVFTQLLDMKAFDNINMAPLFRLGFQFEDDDMGLVVSHILKWPTTRALYGEGLGSHTSPESRGERP